jgi:uncharacterized SAM-binding protein YcdF (DUF218 family)
MKSDRRKYVAICASGVLLLAIVAVLNRAGPALIVTVPERNPDIIISLASHEWERLPAAAVLAHKYPSAEVVLTLPSPATEHNCHRCEERPALLRQARIDARRIHVLSDPVSSTRDEALACLRYASRTKAREIVIVTSPYHTRRALATFQRMFQATDVKLAIYPALGTSAAHPKGWWRRHYDRAYVAYECAAIVYYALRFGIYP